MHPTRWFDRTRRRRQQQAARPRGDVEHSEGAAQGLGVGTDPGSTLGRQESKPLVVACMYVRHGLCDRIKVAGEYVHGVIPPGAEVSHGLCPWCMSEHFPVQAADLYAHEAVVS